MCEYEVDHRRLSELGRPRYPPKEFVLDRPSLYWIDYRPFQGTGPNGTTEFGGTPRLKELATSRDHNPMTYSRYMRGSPMWPVSEGAKSYSATERIEELSKSKMFPTHRGFDRNLPIPVSSDAKTASSTDRLDNLAKQVEFKTFENSVDSIPEDEFCEPIVKVSKGAKSSRSTPRLDQLAMPKPVLAKPDQSPFRKIPAYQLVPSNNDEEQTGD